jgi:hypothetical protein
MKIRELNSTNALKKPKESDFFLQEQKRMMMYKEPRLPRMIISEEAAP